VSYFVVEVLSGFDVVIPGINNDKGRRAKEEVLPPF
jgi:hypothetical protein